MRTWFLLLAPLAAVTAGCGDELHAIEVLPPRTSSTCSAPTVKAAALARGLLDLDASETLHGAYTADLRVSATRDLHVEGLSFGYQLPDGAGSATTSEAEKASGDRVTGGLVLAGDDDDLRAGVLEDVVLLPRELAVALRDDGGVEADDTRFATVVVEMRILSDGGALEGTASTFALDVCRGCLVAEPDAEECPTGVAERAVCRPGQDVPLYGCK